MKDLKKKINHCLNLGKIVKTSYLNDKEDNQKYFVK